MFETLEAKRLLVLAGSLVIIVMAVAGIRSREYRSRSRKRITGIWAILFYVIWLVIGILAFLAFLSFPENLAFFCLTSIMVSMFCVVIELFAPHRPAS
jgi:hypothetical protein